MMARFTRFVALPALVVALLTGPLDLHAAVLAPASAAHTTISVDATHAHQPAHFEASELAAHEPCCGCVLRNQWSSVALASRDTPWAAPRALTVASRPQPPQAEFDGPGRPRAPPSA